MSVEQDIEILLSYEENWNNQIPMNETYKYIPLTYFTNLPDITYWILSSCAAAISTVSKGAVYWMRLKKTSRNLWCFLRLLWNTEYFSCTQYVFRCGTANIRYLKYSTNRILRMYVKVGRKKYFQKINRIRNVFRKIPQILQNYTKSISRTRC